MSPFLFNHNVIVSQVPARADPARPARSAQPLREVDDEVDRGPCSRFVAGRHGKSAEGPVTKSCGCDLGLTKNAKFAMPRIGDDALHPGEDLAPRPFEQPVEPPALMQQESGQAIGGVVALRDDSDRIEIIGRERPAGPARVDDLHQIGRVALSRCGDGDRPSRSLRSLSGSVYSSGDCYLRLSRVSARVASLSLRAASAPRRVGS
jgi:hypothetical protein